MFCRNCGKELTRASEFCMNCGAKPMGGSSFCPGCGAPTTPLTEICTKCGVRVAKGISGKTWKPTIGGILCIVAGSIGVFCVPLLTLILSVIAGIAVWPKESSPNPIIGLGILGMIFAMIAIVGGVHAYRRRRWGLALAGSICALFGPAGFLGIPAIIFVIRGKSEFK